MPMKSIISSLFIAILFLDDLLESTVDRRTDVGDVLPELNSGHGPLGDALGGEFELLLQLLVYIQNRM